jgi:hypothetical protein
LFNQINNIAHHILRIQTVNAYGNSNAMPRPIQFIDGFNNVFNIAKQGAIGGRLEALHFGVADYAASNRARTTNIGGLNPDYPGDQWHFAISRMTVACRYFFTTLFNQINNIAHHILRIQTVNAYGNSNAMPRPIQFFLILKMLLPPMISCRHVKTLLKPSMNWIGRGMALLPCLNRTTQDFNA